jgi:hypothetical protein
MTPSAASDATHDDVPPAPPGAAFAQYIDAAARMQRIDLEPDVAARVLEQFERIAAIAAPMLAYPVNDHDEPAPVYRLSDTPR